MVTNAAPAARPANRTMVDGLVPDPGCPGSLVLVGGTVATGGVLLAAAADGAVLAAAAGGGVGVAAATVHADGAMTLVSTSRRRYVPTLCIQRCAGRERDGFLRQDVALRAERVPRVAELPIRQVTLQAELGR